MSHDKRIARFAAWRQNPAVMPNQLWGATPDLWQAEAMEAFPKTRRLAMKACTGPGKSTVLAWLGWNFLLTRPYPIIGAASITASNLKANLWRELLLWHSRSPILQELFEVTGEAIFLKESPKTWRLEARTWGRDAEASQIGNALAGIHADYVMWLLDETGDYPESVMPVCEGIFSGAPKEAHIVQAGNPTRLGGPLYRACTGSKDLWHVVEITADPDDPKRTPRVSKEFAEEQIRQYGRESPWVQVRIFGKFPPASLNALIGPDEMSEAMRRAPSERDIGNAPKIIGVDVARFGDDASVIFPRQGIAAFNPIKLRNVTSDQGAALVVRRWNEWEADACFVDDTGGYGAGWIDHIRLLGHSPIGVGFATTAHDKARFYNKRAEIYWDMIDWIKRGGALPNVPELTQTLTQMTYTFKGDQILMEPKEMLKARLGFSPDDADALALTFAEPVTPRRTLIGRSVTRHQAEYDPMGSR